MATQTSSQKQFQAFSGLQINSLILHSAPTIWSFNLQSLFLQHISDLPSFKNSQSMICISPCWYPYGTENIQLNFIYPHGSFTKCIKNVPRAWLHISYLPASILLSPDTHFKRYIHWQTWTQNDPALTQSYFYIVFPTEKCNTSSILPENTACSARNLEERKCRTLFSSLFFSNVTYLECFSYWTENLVCSSIVSFLPKFATYTLYHVLPKVCRIWVIIQKCSPLLYLTCLILALLLLFYSRALKQVPTKACRGFLPHPTLPIIWHSLEKKICLQESNFIESKNAPTYLLRWINSLDARQTKVWRLTLGKINCYCRAFWYMIWDLFWHFLTESCTAPADVSAKLAAS